MKECNLGTNGVATGAIGLGCMGMSGMYGPADRAESIGTIRSALDAGVTLLDTGDFYGMGHNELLIAEALRETPRDSYQLSVKFGALRDAGGAFVGHDCRPKAIRNFLAYSLRRLGTDHIDIYRPARLDPDVPIEDTVGEIGRCVEAGWVRHIGLSEVGPATLRRAAATYPITDLQIEYSLFSRGIEDVVLPTCRELGIGITAYGVLSRGLLGGRWGRGSAAPGDSRRMSPRFQEANLNANLALVEALREIADVRGTSVAQLAVAWVLAQGADIVPVVGSRTREQLAEALGAVTIRFSPDELADVEHAVPAGSASGERYLPALLAQLDSERR